MRLAIVVVLLLAGCASESAPDAARWTFTERIGEEEPLPLGEAEAFVGERTLIANASMRQLGGQWHGSLPAGEKFTMRFVADVDMRVQFRVRDASGATGSGLCDWAADSREEKPIGVAMAGMRSTARTCEIDVTPSILLSNDDEPVLRWEARSAAPEPGGWTLQFAVETPTGP